MTSLATASRIVRHRERSAAISLLAQPCYRWETGIQACMHTGRLPHRFALMPHLAGSTVGGKTIRNDESSVIASAARRSLRDPLPQDYGWLLGIWIGKGLWQSAFEHHKRLVDNSAMQRNSGRLPRPLIVYPGDHWVITAGARKDK